MCGVYPDAATTGAGEEISSTYEGRHITMLEKELIHPDHDDGFVDAGDPVIICLAATETTYGQAVGVAMRSASADTDLIAVDTEGIWKLMVHADDDNGAKVVNPGDPLFISDSSFAAAGANGVGSGLISKIQNLATQVPFGYALGIVASGESKVIAVKVHFDPNYTLEAQLFRTIFVADPSVADGAYAAAMKLTVDSDIAQTGGRLCALSVNLEPGAALAAQTVLGAEICTYLAADIAVAGALCGLFVETQGGLSYASDVRSLYVYLAMNADPGAGAEVVRLEHNSGTAAWLDTFIAFVGDGQHVWDFGPLTENSAWSKDTAPNGAAVGHIHVMVGVTEMEIPLYAAA